MPKWKARMFNIAIALLLAALGFCGAQESWVKQTNPLPEGPELFGIHFLSPDTGFAMGAGGTLWATTDGGLTWAKRQVGH